MVEKKSPFQFFANLIMIVLALCCLFPFALLVMSSLTEENTLIREGYSLFPKQFSAESYTYLFKNIDKIGRAYGITVFVTFVGTIASLLMTVLMAYPLSRKDFYGRNIFAFFVFFTMLFNGGLVPTYIMYTQVIPIKNTYLALLIPNLLLNVFNVIVCRTFFITGIPMEVIEAAKIDGAGETRIFLRIVLPMSTSIIGTVSLMTGMGYWNDWINGLYYITKPEYYSLQNLLNRMMTDIQFLQTGSNSMMQGLNEMIANLPQASVRMALAVVGILPVLVIFPFVNRFFAKGVAMGAIKG